MTCEVRTDGHLEGERLATFVANGWLLWVPISTMGISGYFIDIAMLTGQSGGIGMAVNGTIRNNPEPIVCRVGHSTCPYSREHRIVDVSCGSPVRSGSPPQFFPQLITLTCPCSCTSRNVSQAHRWAIRASTHPDTENRLIHFPVKVGTRFSKNARMPS